ncbi:hypothetical protein [Bacillus sp. AK031]
MKKNNWEETEIENMLREMPSIKDNRSREEIYKAIGNKKVVKKQRTWAYPALAGLAALMIIVMITPSLFESLNNSNYEDSASDMAAQEAADAGSAESEIAALPENTEERAESGASSLDAAENRDGSIMMTMEAPERLNLYEEDLQQYDVLTYGMVTPDAESVPVSVLVDKKVEADWLERFNEVSKQIPEQEWGFADYYPLSSSLALVNNELSYTVSQQDLTRMSSAEEQLFTESLLTALEATDYTMVHLRNEDGGIPMFPHMGEIAELSQAENRNRGYFTYPLENGATYLVPGENEYDSIREAVSAMKQSPNGIMQSVIPESIQPMVTVENNQLTISFEEILKLGDSAGDENLLLIEGLLLTAKDFGFEQVMFENIDTPAWKEFDFSKPVSVPVSPNKKILK